MVRAFVWRRGELRRPLPPWATVWEAVPPLCPRGATLACALPPLGGGPAAQRTKARLRSLMRWRFLPRTVAARRKPTVPLCLVAPAAPLRYAAGAASSLRH